MRANLFNQDNQTVLECYDSVGNRHEYVLAFKSHPCVFLEQGRCAIYGSAPAGCGNYPYRADGRLGKTSICPMVSKALFLAGVGRSDRMNENLHEISQYRKKVAEWNKKKGTREQCVAFLLDGH